MPKSNVHSLYTILSIRLVILLCSFKFNVNIILILYIVYGARACRSSHWHYFDQGGCPCTIHISMGVHRARGVTTLYHTDLDAQLYLATRTTHIKGS